MKLCKNGRIPATKIRLNVPKSRNLKLTTVLQTESYRLLARRKKSSQELWRKKVQDKGFVKMIIIFWHIRTMRIPIQKLKFDCFLLKSSPEIKNSLEPLMKDARS